MNYRFEQIIFENLEKYAGRKLEFPDNHKIQINSQYFMRTGINKTDMGLLVIFEMKTKNKDNMISLFLNADINADMIEKFCEIKLRESSKKVCE